MTDNILDQALKVSIEFELTELKMMRMYYYQKVAKKAYRRWMETHELHQQYDKAAYDREFWTILKTKQQLEDESFNHYAAFLRCINSVRQIKKTL